jgi:hypothetical protein
MSVDLDVEAIRVITRYAHWIPILSGRYKQFLSKNYPGWEWNQLIPLLVKKQVLVKSFNELGTTPLAHGLSISNEIESVRITRTSKGSKVTIRKINLKPNLRRNK